MQSLNQLARISINTNNAFLAASRQGGLPRPFTRPLYSTRGTRQGYNARFVPFFGSSDHMTFLDGPINTPAVALVNWDDNYIHSSDDDLWQIDQTQLRRNNFLIGSIAYFLARATPADVPRLSSETYAQGTKRLANDLRVAMDLIREGKAPGNNWKEANYLVDQGIQREQHALNTIRVFAKGDSKANSAIDQLLANMKRNGVQLACGFGDFLRASSRFPSGCNPVECRGSGRGEKDSAKHGVD